jgi:hypothetical protein
MRRKSDLSKHYVLCNHGKVTFLPGTLVFETKTGSGCVWFIVSNAVYSSHGCSFMVAKSGVIEQRSSIFLEAAAISFIADIIGATPQNERHEGPAW